MSERVSMSKEKNRVVVVCGPTASGKTALGVQLAAEFNGEIISADSRQVYRGMDIGTGKDLDEYGMSGGYIPYHCIDIADPSETYSLYRYIGDFYSAADSVFQKNKNPFVVGGTGLYIEAVLNKYDVPNVPENVVLRKTLMKEEHDDLKKKLRELSPSIYSKTDLSSKKRTVRAIEVAIHMSETDGPIKENTHPGLSYLILAVRWPREDLIQRIDLRLEMRLKQGMIEEVDGLLKKGISAEKLKSFGMEYRYITLFLSGEISYEDMVASLKTSIHRLSKRQMTWFRGMERRGFILNWLDRADPGKARELTTNFLS